MPGVSYTLHVDGRPAPAEVVDAVEEVEVESHLALADILRLRLGIGLTEGGSSWSLVDDATFSRLASVRLLATIGSAVPTAVFDGYVTETGVELSDDPAHASLDVVALDTTALMNLEERVREWPNMPDSAIAAMIFGEHGLLPVVDATQPARIQLETTVIQRDTDIRFLRHLAARNGFDVYVQPGVAPGVVEGHFHPPRLEGRPVGVLSVAMGEATNVARFSARHEMLRPTEVAGADVDAGRVDEQTAEARAGELTPLGRRALLNGDRPRRSLLRPGGMSGAGELQTLAQAAVDRSTWAVSADGEVDTAVYGDLLRVGSTVLVRGAGATLSGAYLVERVHHHIAGERYAQHFTLRRNALEATGAEPFASDTGLPS